MMSPHQHDIDCAVVPGHRLVDGMAVALWPQRPALTVPTQVYKHMGRVIGRFYTADGNRTAELERVEAVAAEYSRQQPPDRPSGSPCNVQWSASAGENASLGANARHDVQRILDHMLP